MKEYTYFICLTSAIYGLDLWENWWFEDKLRGYGKPVIINNGRLLGITLEDYETILIYKYDYNLRRYSNFKVSLLIS